MVLESEHVRSADDTASDDEEGCRDVDGVQVIEDQRGVRRRPIVVADTEG